jgi:hypothetical protein
VAFELVAKTHFFRRRELSAVYRSAGLAAARGGSGVRRRRVHRRGVRFALICSICTAGESCSRKGVGIDDADAAVTGGEPYLAIR